MEKETPRSVGSLILAVLNFLNGLAAAGLAFALLSSAQPSENTWGVFQAISAAGMIGLGLCLFVYRKSALACAVITILLSLIEAGIGIPFAASKSPGLGGDMVSFFGSIGTGILAVVPTVTLIALLAGRKPTPPSEVR
ncbi:hypothetical protein AYO40_04705 [Planctomycetaceae bacterium SCGC AG-212-D15]|nr:hypothetical protein AYO40_04705 [Planctomycetaceae bacterium SCGC AG-212-D15]